MYYLRLVDLIQYISDLNGKAQQFFYCQTILINDVFKTNALKIIQNHKKGMPMRHKFMRFDNPRIVELAKDIEFMRKLL